MDAVVSDFLSGAAETLTPDAASDHWDVIEGQGSCFTRRMPLLPSDCFMAASLMPWFCVTGRVERRSTSTRTIPCLICASVSPV